MVVVVLQFNGTSTPKESYSAKTGDNDCNVNSNCYSLITALCESNSLSGQVWTKCPTRPDTQGRHVEAGGHVAARYYNYNVYTGVTPWMTNAHVWSETSSSGMDDPFHYLMLPVWLCSTCWGTGKVRQAYPTVHTTFEMAVRTLRASATDPLGLEAEIGSEPQVIASLTQRKKGVSILQRTLSLSFKLYIPMLYPMLPNRIIKIDQGLCSIDVALQVSSFGVSFITAGTRTLSKHYSTRTCKMGLRKKRKIETAPTRPRSCPPPTTKTYKWVPGRFWSNYLFDHFLLDVYPLIISKFYGTSTPKGSYSAKTGESTR